VGNAKITGLKIIHRVSNSIQTRFPFLVLSASTAARRAEMTHVSEQSTTFNPETLHILGSALDDAWQRLEVRVHLNGSGEAIRTILAKHIIAMAQQGERDPQRLIEGALTRLKL
jgi:hypothetical protein